MEFEFQFQEALDSGWSEEKIRAHLNKKGRGAEADAYFSTQEKSKDGSGFFEQIGEDIKKRVESTQDSIARFINGGYQTDPALQQQLEQRGQQDKANQLKADQEKIGVGTNQGIEETAIQVAGSGAGIANDVIYKPLLDKAINTTIPLISKLPNSTPIPPTISMGQFYNVGQLKAAVQSPVIQWGLAKAQQGVAGFQQFKAENPKEAATVEAVFNIAQFLPVGKLLGIGGKAATKTATEVTERGLNIAKEAGEKAFQKTADIGDSIADTLSSVAQTRKANVLTREAKNAAIKASHPDVQNVVNQGIDLTEAQLVEQAMTRTPEQGSAIKRILDTVKTKAGDGADIVGEYMIKPVQFIEKTKDEFGGKLSQLVQGFKDVKVPEAAKNAYLALKKEMPQIGIDKKGVLNFSKTAISMDDAAKATIQKYFSAMKKRTADTLHTLRQEVFELLGGKKTAGLVLSESEDKGLNAIRKGLMETLDTAVPGYRELNTQYAKLEDSMKLIRQNFRGVLENSDDVLATRGGELARRLTSRTKAKTQGFLETVNNAAKAHGFDSGVDIQQLQEVLNVMDNLYGTTVKKGTDFASGVAKGVKQGVKGIPKSIGDVVGLVAEHTPFIKDLGQTIESKRKAFEDFIESILKRGKEGGMIDAGDVPVKPDAFKQVGGVTDQATIGLADDWMYAPDEVIAEVPEQRALFSAAKAENITDSDIIQLIADPKTPYETKLAEQQMQVIAEMDNAEAGRRIFTENLGLGDTMVVTGQKSTFPDWIPSELRKKTLLNSVTEHILNGTLPRKADELRLYKIVKEEMDNIPQAMDEIIADIGAGKELPDLLNDDGIKKADELIKKYEAELNSTQQDPNITRVDDEVKAQGSKEIEVPEKEISPELQARAEADWEANYGDRNAELLKSSHELAERIKKAKKKDRPALEAQKLKVDQESARLEDEWLAKYRE